MQKENKLKNKPESKKERKPDEAGGFHVEGHIKIFDPENNKVIRNIRG